MGKASKGEHYFVVTEDIAKSKLTPADKLVACSITKRTRDRTKTDFMLLRASWIMEDWNISQEIVTSALKNLVSLGIIEKKRCGGGNLVKWVGWGTPGMEEEDWDAIPANTVSETVKPGLGRKKSNRKTRFPLQTVKPGFACKPSNPVFNPSSVPSSVPKNEENQEEETSVPLSQSTRASAVLPVAPPLVLSARLIGMINAAFPANPNAVLHQIRMAGWDERRVEAGLLKTDPRKGVNYFASICRRMADDEVEAMFSVAEEDPAVPKRILSKDGKRVLVNGEWIEAATPYPNLPAPPAKPDYDVRLAVTFVNFWFDVDAERPRKITEKHYDKHSETLDSLSWEYQKGRLTADEFKQKCQAVLVEAGHPYTRKEGK